MSISYTDSTTNCTYDTFTSTSTASCPNSQTYTINTNNTVLNKFYTDLSKYLYTEEDPQIVAVQIKGKKVDLTKDFLQNVRFKKVIERNPGRVYEFIFQDDTHIKTVCAEEDLEWFDLEYAFYLALAKYLYGDQYTLAGVMSKIANLMCDKNYIKIVKKGMKIFKEDQKAEKELKAEKEKIKQIKRNHYLKNQRRKVAKKEKENENLKNIIKEAINESK